MPESLTLPNNSLLTNGQCIDSHKQAHQHTLLPKVETRVGTRERKWRLYLTQPSVRVIMAIVSGQLRKKLPVFFFFLNFPCNFSRFQSAEIIRIYMERRNLQLPFSGFRM